MRVLWECMEGHKLLVRQQGRPAASPLALATHVVDGLRSLNVATSATSKRRRVAAPVRCVTQADWGPVMGQSVTSYATLQALEGQGIPCPQQLMHGKGSTIRKRGKQLNPV